MTRYTDLLDHLRRSSWPDVVIGDIKLKYQEKIASNRQLSKINTITDVLSILEKRDEINEDNYTILEDLYILLRNIKEINSEGISKTKQRENGTNAVFAVEVVQVLPDVPNNLYDRLHQVISLQIGHKWKDFARGLRIIEGQIDELEDKHKNISDRVRDILVYHKHYCPKQHLYSSICEALRSARRKDLALDVQRIIDTY